MSAYSGWEPKEFDDAAEPAPPGDAPSAREADPDPAAGSGRPAPAAPDAYDPFAGADGVPPADGAAMGGESAQAGFVYDAASGWLPFSEQVPTLPCFLSETSGASVMAWF